MSARKPLDPAGYRETVAQVKRQRLRAHRIDLQAYAASGAGLVLGHLQHAGGEALAALFLRHEEQLDEQPAARRFAHQPAHDLAIVIAQRNLQCLVT